MFTRGRLTLVAFVTLALASAYPMQVNGWNQNSHYALVRALADGTPRIDVSRTEIGDLGTGDVATIDGHVYSNKAPGLAFASLPAYAVTVAMGMRTTGDPTRVIWALHLWAVTGAFLLLLYLVYRAADRLEPGFGLAPAVTLGLGTLVLPFSTLFFAHVLSAALAFASFAVLLRERAGSARRLLVAVAGVLAGLAVTAEYSLVIVALVLGAYALRERRDVLVRGISFAAGALAGTMPLLAYNTWAVGSPFHSTYSGNFVPLGGFFGLGAPSGRLLFDLLFSAWGLLTLTPVVACGVAGAVLAYRGGRRAEALVVLGVVGLALAWACSYRLGTTPFGGLGPPRYLIMILPFVAYALAPAVRAFPLTTLVLAGISAFQMAVITATNPLAAYDGDWLRRVAAKDFSQTALSLVGITGWYSIVPCFLAALAAAATALMATARPTLRARDPIIALLSVGGWTVVALAAANPAGRAPSTGYVLAIALVSAAATIVLATAAGAHVTLLERVHEGFVYPRRVARLSQELAEVIPTGASVLDVGTGDGAVAAALARRRDDLTIEGVEVFLRPQPAIPTTLFDGLRIPHGDASVDVVLFVDSLHHMEAPLTLLREARRVASRAIVIKDHLLEGPFARQTLRLMDRVGNERFGVGPKHEYWPRTRWLQTFEELGLVPAAWTESLRLYPWWARFVFDRSLHFLARLEQR